MLRIVRTALHLDLTTWVGLPANAPCQATSGRLLLTGGVSSIGGAAGDGLRPWAMTGSYAARGQFGACLSAPFAC